MRSARSFSVKTGKSGVNDMHLALYRKYRPKVFGDVCGQDHITSVLKYQSAENKLSHAYLFCGSRGTGKTSSAKILAKAANCLSPIDGDPCGKCEACLAIEAGTATDVVEMDAASNNGVDNIRELRNEVAYSPAMLRRRVYIIDEVHMLTQSAFNALLKTLEEPPPYVMFILATTELHKLPATIVSRCQRFDFRRIGIPDIKRRLSYIAENEGIQLEAKAAERIARLAEGGMRDAVSLFELCAGGGVDVTDEVVESVLGVSGYAAIAAVADAVAQKNVPALFKAVADTVASSKDISVFWQELIAFWRDMLVAKYADDFKGYLDLTEDEAETLRATAQNFKLPSLVYQSGVLDEAARSMTLSPQTKRVTAELALVKMCDPAAEETLSALSARIAALEDKISLISAGALSIKAEPATELPKAVSTLPQAAEPTVNEKPDDDFVPIDEIDVITEKLASSYPMAMSFISSAKLSASPDFKSVRIVPDSDFARTMLDTPDIKRAVAEAFVTSGLTESVPNVTVCSCESRVGAKNGDDDLFGE